ncbi:MAG: hypothetical protein IIA89_00270 [Chloroflexi bacterium]|nr:hypothetical protein [Chloroflexota bacterium]
MNNKRALSNRLIAIVMLILIWVIVWNSIFAITTGQLLVGIVGGVVGLALIGMAIEGSIMRKLEGREVPDLALLMLGLIILVLVYGEIRDLIINDLEFLGEFYLPGLIALIRILGSFGLAALLIWETFKLMRKPLP